MTEQHLASMQAALCMAAVQTAGTEACLHAVFDKVMSAVNAAHDL